MAMQDPCGAVDPLVLAQVAASAPDATAVLDVVVHHGRPLHRLRWLNTAAARLLAFDADALGADGDGTDLAALFGTVAAEEVEHLLATGVAGSSDVRLCRSDGSGVPAQLTATPLGEHAGRRWWAIGLRERTAEQRVLDNLAASEERFRVLAEQAPIGIFRSDLGLRLGYANARCAEILGLDVDGVLGAGWLAALPDDEHHRVVDALEEVLAGREIELHQVRLLRADGSFRWVDLRVAPLRSTDRAAGFIGSIEDVTDRRLLEQTLAHDATHDRLTGLPNRTLLWDRLQAALDVDAPEVAVLFLDLDDFKLINDSLGHEAGDELLLAVTSRLKAAVRPGDLVTRFGGDEFVVVCEGVASRRQAIAIAERLLRSLAAPVSAAGRDVLVTTSVGVVTLDQSGCDPESLLRDADVALYQAKGAGKNRWAIFDERSRTDATERLALAQELHRAIDSGELWVAYQPIVDLATGRVTAVEALSRWTSSRFGPVSPARFIALAEDVGLINRLGYQVLDAACEQLGRWRTELGALAPDHVAVNLSARQLADASIVATVLQTLNRYRLEPSSLCLELTETAFVNDLDLAMSLLGELRAYGVRLSLDDFGTGYSSLSYLRQFPGDYVKIDRSFVYDLRTDHAGAAIVEAVISLADAIGLATVGEGVETAEEMHALRRLGCAFGQGWHLGRPLPADELSAFLQAPQVETR